MNSNNVIKWKGDYDCMLKAFTQLLTCRDCGISRRMITTITDNTRDVPINTTHAQEGPAARMCMGWAENRAASTEQPPRSFVLNQPALELNMECQ
jgi:hypothetical protein